MSKRSNHYEAAFAAYLRRRRIPYLAVDESRRGRPPLDVPADVVGSLKNVDFIVSSPGCSWLVDVKGRSFPSGKQYWKNWSTLDDVDSLGRWRNLFAGRFRAMFVFAYNITGETAPLPEAQLFEFRGRRYAFLGVRWEDYAAGARLISPKWETVALPSALFRRRARPFDELLETPAAAVPDFLQPT